jgi:pyrimidine operon attenuation protein/uracil phosphoribosyltransferase
MVTNVKSVPSHWKTLLDSDAVSRSIARMSYEIVERNPEVKRLAIVGIRTCGEFVGRRLCERISEMEGIKVPFGVIDITLYRDDLNQTPNQPTLRGTDLPFAVSGARVVLVDDVFYTGRTVRAALDAIIDFGRPSCVELAALVDRGHREFPIRPDYVGKNVPTAKQEMVKVRLSEQGFADGVYLVGPKEETGSKS